MTHDRTSHAGIRVTLFWPAVLVALLAGVPGVWANVTPPTMLLVHVQQNGPDYCDPSGVYECRDLVQTTGETGALVFVVYMVCAHGAPGTISSLDFTLQWDWGWSLWDLANCTDAQFSYDYDYLNNITLHFNWPGHPYPPGLMPLCSFLIDANGHGCCEVLDDAVLHWSSWYETPVPGRAEAGVECEYTCLRTCDPWGSNCGPHLTPEELRFELSQGLVGQGLLQSVVTGCVHAPIRFDATESWVTLEVEQTSDHSQDVYVTVNTAGLAVGEYEAWVSATYDTRDCSRIYLTVTEESPETIPDDDAAPPGEARPTTWGGVKDLYRGR